MKAIRVHQFGGPEVLQIEDVAVPQPGAGQVLVRVEAIGVNPVETYWRAGANPKVKPPYTPGTDAAGTVEEVGPDTAGLQRGRRIYTSGTLSGAYAQFALCAAEQVHPLPDNVTIQQGAGVNIPYATAYRALFQRGSARPGETVLVHGASGGVGTATTQMARAAGLTVIGTAGSGRGIKLVREQGAHHVLDHTREGYLDELAAITGGHGVDLIIEMLANVNLGRDLAALAPRGRVVVVGSRGKVEITPRDAMSREADIRGVMLFAAGGEELREIHRALFAGLENGTLRPIIGKELPLAAAAQAHADVMAAGAFGKIVLVPRHALQRNPPSRRGCKPAPRGPGR
jgi:NADPH2:quinone reductase